MPRFAANIGDGWLFNEVRYLKRFTAARKAGFRAVECAWPYATPAHETARAAREAGVEFVLLNTPFDAQKGKVGFLGYGIHPEHESDFDRSLDKALAYADTVGCPNVHVMSGILLEGQSPDVATRTLVDNLKRAKDRAYRSHPDIALVVEPICNFAAPGYFLSSVQQALAILHQVNVDVKPSEPRVSLQFDMYHAQIADGNIVNLLKENIDIIKHMQLAGVPNRNEPSESELDYSYVFREIDQLSWSGWIGCEYKPKGDTVQGLSKWFTPHSRSSL